MLKRAFTLLELLIVVSIVTLLGVALLLLLNPKSQFDKARDSRRVSDLDMLRKAFEEFYNDKGCYPRPAEICFSGSYNGNPVGNPCFICGNEPGSPSFSPYLKKVPCDPTYPTNRYLYHVEGSDLNCPKSYKLYTKFNYDSNPASGEVGCGKGGCGPAPRFGYEYGGSSPKTQLDINKNF